jgi:hypothetical protein
MLLKKSQIARRQFSYFEKTDPTTSESMWPNHDPITLPGLPASLSSGNEVSHIFTRKSRAQPKEILITSAKRLFQQHRSKLDCYPDTVTSPPTSYGHAPASVEDRGVPLPVASRCSKRSYSITSSARASTVAGRSRPSALAVLRLITNSYLVGACTGRSAGFTPLRIRSTYAAVGFQGSTGLGP